jgi:hypothetical protein
MTQTEAMQEQIRVVQAQVRAFGLAFEDIHRTSEVAREAVLHLATGGEGLVNRVEELEHQVRAIQDMMSLFRGVEE